MSSRRRAPKRTPYRAPAQPVDVAPLPVGEASATGGALAEAFSLIGTPYKYAGSSPQTGFDCSGFTQYVFRAVGIELPRSAITQYTIGEQVDREDLRTGDLVFFRSRRGWHVGIYSNEGNFIHAPNSRDRVKVTPLSAPYYSKAYLGARRILPRLVPEPSVELPALDPIQPPAELAEASSSDSPR